MASRVVKGERCPERAELSGECAYVKCELRAPHRGKKHLHGFTLVNKNGTVGFGYVEWSTRPSRGKAGR